ncbi:uncharacterized protein AMSG_11589 [Thecamonas trahens ATCC 50062]|uniref:Uncharacterized protein n=1 Tax=Thecamonas trahens ATCC 50062 TaxID=461836 RepID=A0A0L0D3P5_THETB|nr:hypothetical protein AMSG_11589 [Thecamonas trahens ATCC 50062]KNC45923.1 hypothetical protein AMSG_11589 [Thecamonas trahens ATCC 50062]|eukprot:XP_013763187.1 hypothetical protein AMSG_11589 [Thecamonas trahens ATCC 50062]
MAHSFAEAAIASRSSLPASVVQVRSQPLPPFSSHITAEIVEMYTSVKSEPLRSPPRAPTSPTPTTLDIAPYTHTSLITAILSIATEAVSKARRTNSNGSGILLMQWQEFYALRTILLDTSHPEHVSLLNGAARAAEPGDRSALHLYVMAAASRAVVSRLKSFRAGSSTIEAGSTISPLTSAFLALHRAHYVHKAIDAPTMTACKLVLTARNHAALLARNAIVAHINSASLATVHTAFRRLATNYRSLLGLPPHPPPLQLPEREALAVPNRASSPAASPATPEPQPQPQPQLQPQPQPQSRSSFDLPLTRATFAMALTALRVVAAADKATHKDALIRGECAAVRHVLELMTSASLDANQALAVRPVAAGLLFLAAHSGLGSAAAAAVKDAVLPR